MAWTGGVSLSGLADDAPVDRSSDEVHHMRPSVVFSEKVAGFENSRVASSGRVMI